MCFFLPLVLEAMEKWTMGTDQTVQVVIHHQGPHVLAIGEPDALIHSV
jgi:hypothetical protein